MKIIRLIVPAAFALLAFLFVNAQASTANQQPSPNPALQADRKRIDSLDQCLLRIIGERQRVVRRIGVYKAQHHIPPLQAARFQEVVKKAVANGAKEGLSAEFVEKLFNTIHDESLRIEESIRSQAPPKSASAKSQ